MAWMNTTPARTTVHGTKHEDKIPPVSHGYVRMRNVNVIDFFDLIDEGASILIQIKVGTFQPCRTLTYKLKIATPLTHPKKLRKALLPFSSLPKQAEQHAAKGGEYRLKFLKAIMIVAILASALSLGACAQKKEEVTTTPGKTSYGK